MKNLLVLLLISFFLIPVKAQKKALIIAIGKYPFKTGWQNINSLNDVPIIYNALLENGFKETDVKIIKNENATRIGILKAIKSLYDSALEGDVIYLHYSGHGQQIKDDNGDEIDDLDEAIVPYNAYSKYSATYKGQNHIRDDEMENIITMFRNKLGPNGHFFVLLDSCHSGSFTKEVVWDFEIDDLNSVNDLNLDKIEDDFTNVFIETKLNLPSAPFIMLSSASANQLSSEINGFNVGVLSYVFTKSLKDLGKNVSFLQLFSNIQLLMNSLTPNQQPIIEGNLESIVFSNQRVNLNSFYVVSKIENSKEISLPVGKLNMIFPGTKFGVYRSGSTGKSNKGKITNAEVISSNETSSILRLKNEIKEMDENKYWAFIENPNFKEATLKVFFNNFSDSDLKTINLLLKEKEVAKVVVDSTIADVKISRFHKEIEIDASKLLQIKNKIEITQNADFFKVIINSILNLTQSNYLKNVKYNNDAIKFSFKLIPVGLINSVANDSITINKKYFLEVSNKSSIPIYFSIIKINELGYTEQFLPNPDYNLNNQERLLLPGKSMVFKKYKFNFENIKTQVFLKGFASSKPINILPIPNLSLIDLSEYQDINLNFNSSTYLLNYFSQTIDSTYKGDEITTYEVVHELNE